MRWSLFFVAPVLIGSPLGVLGLPTASNSTLHSFNKRTLVCGVDLRGAVASDCIPAGLNFALKPPSTIEVQKGIKAKPADSACDHQVEIQVLTRAAITAKVCEVVNARSALGTSRASIMTPLFRTMNAHANLLFLDSKVNGRKASYVQNAIAGNKIAKDDLNEAVFNFLKIVKSQTKVVASDLDKDIKAIISAATAEAKTFVPPKDPKARLTSQQQKEKALEEALAAHAKQSATPVTVLWNKVLAAVPK